MADLMGMLVNSFVDYMLKEQQQVASSVIYPTMHISILSPHSFQETMLASLQASCYKHPLDKVEFFLSHLL